MKHNFRKNFRHPVGSINEFLGNSARTDVIGREMYNDGSSCAEVGSGAAAEPGSLLFDAYSPEGWAGAEVRGQIPHLNWGRAALGLPGEWCYGNHTVLKDVLTVNISYIQKSGRQLLELVPTRNWWTPACMTTYYRSKPVSGKLEYPFSGYLTVRERKCITPENVFVGEITLIHDHKLPGEYAISILTPHFSGSEDSNALIVNTETKARCLGEKVDIKGFAALSVSENRPKVFTITLKPFASKTIRYSFCISASAFSCAEKQAMEALNDINVFEKNIREFDAWFEDNVPSLLIDNKDMLKVYYYRWFVVYRGLHDPRKVIPGHPYSRPCFYESPMGGWFGGVVGLSVPVQLQEAKWLRNRTFGYGHIQNWAEGMRNYRGYIQYTPYAIWEYYLNHPDKTVLEAIYDAVKAYCLSKVNSEDEAQLPVQVGSWGTGAEYQANFYQFTDPQWDWRYDIEGNRTQGFEISSLIRLDLATFSIANLMACAKIAAHLGKTSDAEKLQDMAGKMADRMKRDLWDPKTCMFYSADPATGKLADGAPCYDSFMPFMWGVVNDCEYLSVFDKFFDPEWFWDEFPLTTVSKTCPMYWSGNCIAGPAESSIPSPHRYGCSWNGTVWHFSNGLMAEALGRAASLNEGKELRKGWLEFMSRWSEMHFLFGDKSVPVSLEHVRPADGARFRKINDYFHSAWLDPFIRYWLGIRANDESGRVTFDPFTEGEFEIRDLPVNGNELTFLQKYEDGVVLRAILDMQGSTLAESRDGSPVTVRL